MVLSIFWSVVFFRSAITIAMRFLPRKSYVNQRAFVLSQHYALQRPWLEDAEDVDRQLLVAAQRKRGGVHHLKVLHDRFIEGEARIALGVRVALRVGGVDAVHLGRLDGDPRAHLAAARRGRRIGGEERIPRASGEDDDLALLEVADRLAADVRL